MDRGWTGGSTESKCIAEGTEFRGGGRESPRGGGWLGTRPTPLPKKNWHGGARVSLAIFGGEDVNNDPMRTKLALCVLRWIRAAVQEGEDEKIKPLFMSKVWESL